MKIDLHGIRHADTQQKLDTFYWDAMRRGISEVEVVTGISDRMKQIVRDVSREYGFVAEDAPLNPGSMRIRIA